MAKIKLNAARIRELRQLKGMTAATLAEVAGISPRTMTNVEDDRYPGVSLDTLEKLADALEVDREKLVSLQHQDGPKPTGGKVIVTF